MRSGRVRAPSVFIELGYHDNPRETPAWVKNNLDAIARNIVISLCQYFGIPFLEPRPARPAVVDVNWGSLNIRSRALHHCPHRGPRLRRRPAHRHQPVAGLVSGPV